MSPCTYAWKLVNAACSDLNQDQFRPFADGLGSVVFERHPMNPRASTVCARFPGNAGGCSASVQLAVRDYAAIPPLSEQNSYEEDSCGLLFFGVDFFFTTGH